MATSLSTTSLTAPTALKQVTPTQDSTNYQSIIDSALNGISGYQAEVDSANSKQSGNLDLLGELNKALTGKAKDTQTANTDYGVDAEKKNFDQYTQDLNTINANIKGLSNEAKAIPLMVQEKFKNTGATDAGVAPIQTGQLRENAIKALTQASLADITTANITNSAIRYNAAKDKAQQAIDLKYQPIEQQIASLKEQLALNKEYITDPAEKKLVKAQEIALNERSRLLTLEKENASKVSDMVIRARSQGVPPDLAERAAKETDPLKAAQILGKYAGDYLQAELLKSNLLTDKAQRANIYANINKTNAETSALNTPGGKLTADEKKANLAATNLIGLLDEYKTAIDGISFMQANSPAKRTAINSLKGRITAEYKQAKQLGTLDAGVQKLIDSIIPDPGSFSRSSLNNAAQVKAITDFRNSFIGQTPEGMYIESITGAINKSNDPGASQTTTSYINSL